MWKCRTDKIHLNMSLETWDEHELNLSPDVLIEVTFVETFEEIN